MKYAKTKNKIIIEDYEDFSPFQTLYCGQVFSFEEKDGHYLVYSKDKFADIFVENNKIIIKSNDIDYFENYFDLKTDYKIIKNELSKYPVMQSALEFGSGIRILKQDIFETIISFVISANNNIKRITASLFYLRKNYGEKIGDYFAFPYYEKLKTLTEDDFRNAGLGYRSVQMVKLLKELEGIDFENLKNLETAELKAFLVSLSGIGPKVASCILLFAFSRKDIFPVDTWINQMYNQYFEKCDNRDNISSALISQFGELSGYAQQYLFYFQRSYKK